MRILLADDQVQVRSALRLLLEQEPGFLVVGETADATRYCWPLLRKRPTWVYWIGNCPVYRLLGCSVAAFVAV